MSPREALLALLLAAGLASLYIAQSQIGPLWAIAVAVLIAGEALVSVIDDVFPRTGSSQDEPTPQGQ